MTTEPILNNPALKLCIEFALALVDYRELLEEKKKFVIAKPLLGSGTSNGANSFEAQNAESKADCIHEFKNSAKEVAETQYRLTIGSCSNNYPNRDQMIQKREAIHAVWAIY